MAVTQFSIRMEDADLEMIERARLIDRRNRNSFIAIAAIERAREVLEAKA